MKITVVRGDITRQDVEAIVTAANIPLRGGGGVDAAVHAAAGPELLRACLALAPCPAGSAVVTPAFRLTPVKWVVHAVGPRYNGLEDAVTLASAYRAALACADEVGARSMAFPSISTGSYGYPAADACAISVRAVLTADTSVQEVRLIAFGAAMYELWRVALAETAIGPMRPTPRSDKQESDP